MNEMNNGSNGYVDPNMNNQNMNNGYNQNMNYQGQPVNNNEEPPKKNNNALTIVMLLVILGLAGFIIYDKAIKKEEKPQDNNQQNEEKQSGTNNNQNEEPEVLDANTKVFYDVATNAKYYLVETTSEGNGDVYNPTKHTVLDQNKNEVAVIPEVSTSHLWNNQNESLLDAELELTVTATLKDNKIYSLANDPGDSCNFVKYESFMENGSLKSNIVSRYSLDDIQVSGEHC